MKRLVLAVLVIFASACAASQPTKIEKNQAEFYFNQGVAWNEKGDYDKAISEYTKAIEINPSLEEAYSNRGLAYLLLGQSQPGCHDLQKACELGSCIGLTWAKERGHCR